MSRCDGWEVMDTTYTGYRMYMHVKDKVLELTDKEGVVVETWPKFSLIGKGWDMVDVLKVDVKPPSVPKDDTFSPVEGIPLHPFEENLAAAFSRPVTTSSHVKTAYKAFNDKWGITPSNFRGLHTRLMYTLWVDPIKKLVNRYCGSRGGELDIGKVRWLWGKLPEVKKLIADGKENMVPFLLYPISDDTPPEIIAELTTNTITRNLLIAKRDIRAIRAIPCTWLPYRALRKGGRFDGDTSDNAREVYKVSGLLSERRYSYATDWLDGRSVSPKGLYPHYNEVTTTYGRPPATHLNFKGDYPFIKGMGVLSEAPGQLDGVETTLRKDGDRVHINSTHIGGVTPQYTMHAVIPEDTLLQAAGLAESLVDLMWNLHFNPDDSSLEGCSIEYTSFVQDAADTKRRKRKWKI